MRKGAPSPAGGSSTRRAQWREKKAVVTRLSPATPTVRPARPSERTAESDLRHRPSVTSTLGPAERAPRVAPCRIGPAYAGRLRPARPRSDPPQRERERVAGLEQAVALRRV